MDSKQKIVDRVRKLLNLAEDGGATNGEIENAMKMASDLIAKYQIEKTELEASEEEVTEETYGKTFVDLKTRRSPWMGFLAMAVASAVGSVGVYQGSQMIKKGVFGREEKANGYTFYGPDADVALAREVFEEWLAVIATIATGRYGSPFFGDGRAYSIGFASELSKLARDLYKPSTYSGSTDIVPVANALAVKRTKADAWLSKNGPRLSRSGGKVSLGSGSRGAYQQGQSDGRNSGFKVTPTKGLGSTKSLGGRS